MTTSDPASETATQPVCIYRQVSTDQCQRGLCPHHLETCPGDCELRREEPMASPSEAFDGLMDAVRGMRGDPDEAAQAEVAVDELRKLEDEMPPAPDGHRVRRYRSFRDGPVEPPSSTPAYIGCPWCGVEVKVYLWSLHGGGKRCPCGAFIGRRGGVHEPDRSWKARDPKAEGSGT